MTRREHVLALIRVHAFETGKLAVRFYVENRVSYAAASQAVAQGLALRERFNIPTGATVKAVDFKL